MAQLHHKGSKGGSRFKIWGFPKIRGGVSIIRTIVFWGTYWGPPILGNYHFGLGLSVSFWVQGLKSAELRQQAWLIATVKDKFPHP